MFDEYKPYLSIVWRHWWVVLLTTLAAAAAAFLFTAAQPSQYRSSTRLVISPDLNLVEGNDLLRSLDTLDRATIVSTFAEILESSEIRNRAREAMQLEQGELEGYAITAVRLPEANVLEISVTGEDRGRVQATATAVAAAGTRYIEETYRIYDISLLDPATLPQAPISPKPVRNTAVALVLGVVVGTALALVVSPSALSAARAQALVIAKQQPSPAD